MAESLSHYEESLMLSGACGAVLRLAQAYKPHPLPSDRPHYAPDKAATVQHIKLEITLPSTSSGQGMSPSKSVSGLCTTTLIPINDGLTSVEFDAVEMFVEAVALDGGTPLPFELADKWLSLRRFLEDSRVPATNNVTERAIGRSKVRYNTVRPHQALGYLTPQQFLQQFYLA